jgi:hypothetical protein
MLCTKAVERDDSFEVRRRTSRHIHRDANVTMLTELKRAQVDVFPPILFSFFKVSEDSSSESSTTLGDELQSCRV